MGAPVKDNHSNPDINHQSNDTGSPISSIIGLLMLLSVLVVVCFMFKDQIKSWLNKDKKILQKSDDEPQPNKTTSDLSDAEPKANDDESKVNEFEIEQPKFEGEN